MVVRCSFSDILYLTQKLPHYFVDRSQPDNLVVVISLPELKQSKNIKLDVQDKKMVTVLIFFISLIIYLHMTHRLGSRFFIIVSKISVFIKTFFSEFFFHLFFSLEKTEKSRFTLKFCLKL